MYAISEKGSRIVDFFRVWNQILTAETYDELQQPKTSIDKFRRSVQANSAWIDIERNFILYLDLTVRWREHVDFGEHDDVDFPTPLQPVDPNASLNKLEYYLIFAHHIMLFPEGNQRLSATDMEKWFEQAQRIIWYVALTSKSTELMLLLKEREARDDIERWVMHFTTIFIEKLLALRQQKSDEAKALKLDAKSKTPIEFQLCMKSRSQDWVLRIDGLLKRLNLSGFPTLRTYYQSQDLAIARLPRLETRLRVLSCYPFATEDTTTHIMLHDQLSQRFTRLTKFYHTITAWRSHQPNEPFIEGFLSSELTYQLKLLLSDTQFLKETIASSASDPLAQNLLNEEFSRLLNQNRLLLTVVQSKKIDEHAEVQTTTKEAAFAEVIEMLRIFTTDQYQHSDDFRPHQPQEERITECFEWMVTSLNVSTIDEANALRIKIQERTKTHPFKQLNDAIFAILDWKTLYFTKGNQIRPYAKKINAFLDKTSRQRFPSTPLHLALNFHFHNLASVLIIPPVKDQKPVKERTSLLRTFIVNLSETARFIDGSRQQCGHTKSVSCSFVQQLNDAAMIKVTDRNASTIFDRFVTLLNKTQLEFLIRLRLDCIQEQKLDTKSPSIRNAIYVSEACLRQLNLSSLPEWRREFLDRDQTVDSSIQDGKSVPTCLMSVLLPNQREVLMQQFDSIIRFYNTAIYHPLLSGKNDVSINCQLIFHFFSETLHYDLILYIAHQYIQIPQSEPDFAVFEMMAALLNTDDDKIPNRYTHRPPQITEFLKSREVSDSLLSQLTHTSIRFLLALPSPTRAQWATAEMQKLLDVFNSTSKPNSQRQNCLTALLEIYLGLLWSCTSTQELSNLIQSSLHQQMIKHVGMSTDIHIYEWILEYYQQCHVMSKLPGKYDKCVLQTLGRSFYDTACRLAEPSLLNNRLSCHVTSIIIHLMIVVSRLNLGMTTLQDKLNTIMAQSEQVLGITVNRFKAFTYYPLFKPVVTRSLNPAASFELETHPAYNPTSHRQMTRRPRAPRSDNQPRPPSILEPFLVVSDYWKSPRKTLEYYRRFIDQRDIKIALTALIRMIDCLPHLPDTSYEKTTLQIIKRSPYLFSQAQSRLTESELAPLRARFDTFYRSWRDEMESLAEQKRLARQPATGPETQTYSSCEESDDDEEEYDDLSSQMSSEDDSSSRPSDLVVCDKPTFFIPFKACMTDIVLDFELNQHESDLRDFLIQNSGYTLVQAGAVTAAYFRKKRKDLDLLTFGNIKELYQRLHSMKETLDIAHIRCNYLDQAIRKKSKPLIVVYFNTPQNSALAPDKIEIYVLPFTCQEDLSLQLRAFAMTYGMATLYYDLHQNVLLDPLKVRKALLQQFILDTGSECGIDLNAIIQERPEFIMDVFFKLSYYQTIHSKYKLGPTLHEKTQENKHILSHEKLSKKISMSFFDKLFLRAHSLLAIINFKNHLMFSIVFPNLHVAMIFNRLNRFLEFDLNILSNPPEDIKATTQARSEILHIIYNDMMYAALIHDPTITTQTQFDKLISHHLSTCSFDIDGESINYLQDRWWKEFGSVTIQSRLESALVNRYIK